MALGGFDGAHIGHKILIDRAKATGKTVGVMQKVSFAERILGLVKALAVRLKRLKI